MRRMAGSVYLPPNLPLRLPLRGLPRLLRAGLLAVVLAAGAAVAAASRLQIVPDGDPDLALGVAAYEARDTSAALDHFRKAAARNQRTAQFNLAVLLLFGDGVPADPPTGLQWLRRSADNGMPRAQVCIGTAVRPR
jgi:TPR repeat protein